MKKILLNESQMRLLTEEINKNDCIQKLIFADPLSIDFNVDNEAPSGIPISHGLFRLTPVIGGKTFDSNFVNLLAEEVKFGDNIVYQLHINVNKELRRLGIAEKLYTAFILQGYPVCSLYNNRTCTFYDSEGVKVSGDEAIGNLWGKITNNPLIHTEDIVINGKSIGILAYKQNDDTLNESALICENRITDAIFYGCHSFRDYANRLLHIAKTSTIIALAVYIQTIKNIPTGTEQEKQELLQQVESVIEDKKHEEPQLNMASSFQMSDNGIEHLKKYETFSATPYYATKHEKAIGKRTIGYGHVITKKDPSWLQNAKEITEKQATEIFKQDVQIHTDEYIKAVSKLPKELQNPNLYTQGFVDAGISIMYNSGYGNFVRSPFYKTWAKCRIDKDTCQIMNTDYNYTASMIKNSCIDQKGKVLDGLVNRRKIEATMAQI